MTTWKITQTLTEPFDPEWEKLVQLTLGEKIHPGRKQAFLLSRMALQKCLSENGFYLTPLQLELASFSEIKTFPKFTVSLSHTDSIGAALVCNKTDFKSVGIDIEKEHRVVKPEIVEQMSHPDDVRLRNIELWSLKESTYKALMNSGLLSKSVDFRTIEIKDQKWFHSPSQLQGEWEQSIVNSIVVSRSFLRM